MLVVNWLPLEQPTKKLTNYPTIALESQVARLCPTGYLREKGGGINASRALVNPLAKTQRVFVFDIIYPEITMLRLTLFTASLLVVLFSALGCAPTAPTSLPVASAVAPTTAALPTLAVTPTSSSGAITVTDSAQRTVVIPQPPQRIISLAPSTTEIAFVLGLGERVAAVDNNSDYPAEAKALPHFQTWPLSFEQLISLKPDLVLAGTMSSPEEIKKMEELKLPVLVVGVNTASFDTVFSDIALVGKATGTEARASQVTDAMGQKLKALKSKIANAKSRPRVYWELDATDPSKPFTPGPGSFIDDLITLAGGTNVAANTKSTWAQVNSEQVVASNPQVIIMSDVAYGISVESLKMRGGWAAIQAVKDDHVFPIDDSLVSRPGPRIVDGLEAAARLIHPEVFP
jgi:iron complex transport system substrate-binding protein